MKIFVKTFGCTLNQHDSEVIKGILASNGHELTEDLEDAEVVVVNTCAVKQPTENKVINFLKKLDPKKVIVSGCLPLINLERLRRETKVKVILGPSPGEKILLALEKLRKGETFIEVEPSMPSLETPKIRKNPIIEIIPISYGCLGSCSYCCVRFARGKLRSYKPEEIVGRVRKAILEGVKEIWLTSQDTGAYGLDIDSDLPSLLSRILEVDGDFYVRIGMMNPENLKRIFDEFLEVFEDRRIFKFLHLPIQSGDNRILKLMNRRYKIEEVEEMISEFRKKFKELTLETDVICGFPGEGEEEFKHTLDFLRRVKPDVVNISRFFPRPGTEASKMELIHGRIIKGRSRLLTRLCKSISLKRNQRWLGWEGEVLVDEEGKEGSLIGRNFAYKPVVIRSEGSRRVKLGEVIKVRICEAKPTYLVGEIVE